MLDDIATHSIPSKKDVLLTLYERFTLVGDAVKGVCEAVRYRFFDVNISHALRPEYDFEYCCRVLV